MSGFSAEWLALREPVDHAAINAEVRRAFVATLGQTATPKLVDIGCGTGSNMRGLTPWLPGRPQWTLLDYDAGLLAAAARSGHALNVAFETLEADLTTADLTSVFAGADAITSAAFFDLASQAAIERIADATAKAGAVFYTVLTYDGLAAWLPETRAAEGLRTGFNRHQSQDKGLGPALGPGATAALVEAFEVHGYRVMTGPSPWVVGGRHRTMRNELDRGWVAAAVEAGGVTAEAAEAWLAVRRADPDAVTLVGHQDLLAIPG